MFAKPVVHGSEQVLEYLGRYVHRTALADGALVATDDQTVTFRYRDSRDQLRKTMTLPATDFLRRFLQHVPPKGFHRVRAFGLLHPDRRQLLRRLQLLLETVDSPSPRPLRLAKTAPTCPQCGQPTLRLLRRLSPAECLTRGALDLGVASARAPPADHPAHGAGASP